MSDTLEALRQRERELELEAVAIRARVDEVRALIITLEHGPRRGRPRKPELQAVAQSELAAAGAIENGAKPEQAA
jgi:hypothetical protein